MSIPVQIAFRNVPPLEEIEHLIRDHVARLERLFDRIVACRVVVDAPHRRRQKGRRFSVRLELTLPGSDVIISHDESPDPAHEDLPTAVRDAFRHARRRLEDHARVMRGEVKSHPATAWSARPSAMVESAAPVGAEEPDYERTNEWPK